MNANNVPTKIKLPKNYTLLSNIYDLNKSINVFNIIQCQYMIGSLK